MAETNITFSGAGFLGIYHIGVVSCLKFYGKNLLDKIECFGGSSAGALTACMLLTDMDLEASVQFVMYLASKVHGKMFGPFNFEFDPVARIRKTFMAHLPPNAYKIASGKLHISLTRVSDWENVIINEFSSNKELVDALVCTSFVPFFSGVVPPKFKGVSYIDGGFSDNLPQHFSGTTITVSPFSGESDICPNDIHKSNAQFDMRNTNVQFTSDNIYRMSRAFFPPDNDVLSDMCRNGFRDALKYLHTNYPEMLDFGVSIVSIPQCCGFASQEESSEDDNQSVCSCGNMTTTSGISDIEHSIAKGNAISNLVLFPEQLNKILMQTKELFHQSDLCWYLLKAVSNAAQWLVKPCHYASDQLYLFARVICQILLPKIKHICSYSIYASKALNIALDVLETYHETAQYQWHPSMKEEHHTDVENCKRRLQSVQKSLVTLPIIETPKDSRKDCLGYNAPPPSRVASAVGLCDIDFLTQLNEIVFQEDQQSCSSSDTSSDDTNSDIILNIDTPSSPPFCLKDDDGLILKLDREKSFAEENDYGSDLTVVPDSAFDAVVIGGQTDEDGEYEEDDIDDDDSNLLLSDCWKDYVNIRGILT